MRHNEVYFDFGMTPVEAEMLYRHLNAVIGDLVKDDENFEALLKFRDRILKFTRKHPCQYGSDAL